MEDAPTHPRRNVEEFPEDFSINNKADGRDTPLTEELS
jgi:hypothetical protein